MQIQSATSVVASAPIARPSVAPLLRIAVEYVATGASPRTGLVAKAKMRSVRRQTEARAYVTPEGLHLTQRDDVYTHTTTTRRKIERDNDQHSGGGGSSFSGGGGHGRSGSF